MLKSMIKWGLVYIFLVYVSVSAKPADKPTLLPAYCGGDCCIAFKDKNQCEIESRKQLRSSINCKIKSAGPDWTLVCEENSSIEFNLDIEKRTANIFNLTNLSDRGCKTGATVFITQEIRPRIQDTSFCNRDCCVSFEYNLQSKQINPDTWRLTYGPVTYPVPQKCTYAIRPGNRIELKWPGGKMQLRHEPDLIKILSYQNFEMPGCSAGVKMIH